MAKWLIEARASVLRSTTRLELYSAVEWCLSQSRFTYDPQLSYGENAALAKEQSLPALANVLELAEKKVRRL
jgi:hypothetical protein